MTEPQADAEMLDWIASANARVDRFAAVRHESDVHRESHGCDVYPSADGPFLGMLAALVRPERALEVGCGLGYSALWLAHGSGPAAVVDTVERDPVHIELAEAAFRAHGFGEQMNVLNGSSEEVLRRLRGSYEFAFFDGDPSGCVADLVEMERLVPAGGVLLSSNLFLGRYVPDAPWLGELVEYRQRLLDSGSWDTVFLAGGKALSRRR